MIVSDRREVWAIYNMMSKCPFAWLYGYWVSLDYSDGMIKSIMGGLGSNTYDMVMYESNLDRKTLEVDVEFNENEPEVDLLKIEHEFGLEDDSGDMDVPEGHQRVVIERVYVRTLELFKGGRGNSTVDSISAMRRTGYKGSFGASTVNPDCPIRKRRHTSSV